MAIGWTMQKEERWSIYHDECCIVKALCNSGSHLLSNLGWTAAEGKKNGVIWAVTLRLKTTGNVLQGLWKLQSLLTNQKEAPPRCYTWLKTASQESPTFSLQHTVCAQAVHFWVADCMHSQGLGVFYLLLPDQEPRQAFYRETPPECSPFWAHSLPSCSTEPDFF